MVTMRLCSSTPGCGVGTGVGVRAGAAAVAVALTGAASAILGPIGELGVSTASRVAASTTTAATIAAVP
ncbi:MAG: hypothetical protein O2822_03060, partial [Chloroflexi bacterium]|nr:hypothetical protein [Chloroflexota bacterium]